MGSEDFDPCECIFNHEMAMRRLLTILRQSQEYCTDNECIQEGNTMRPDGNSLGVSFFMIVATILFCIAMYIMRPASMRQNTEQKRRERNDFQDPRDPPPVV